MEFSEDFKKIESGTLTSYDFFDNEKKTYLFGSDLVYRRKLKIQKIED